MGWGHENKHLEEDKRELEERMTSTKRMPCDTPLKKKELEEKVTSVKQRAARRWKTAVRGFQNHQVRMKKQRKQLHS